MLSRRTFSTSALAAGLASAAAPTPPPDLATAIDLLRRKKLSPVELTQACLARIDALQPKLNAWITVLREPALAQARQAERDIATGAARGPLHGIPVGLKDLFDTAGVRTTSASAHHRDRVPTEDAAVVKNLKAAGAILLGKLNLDEFAYNYTSETSVFGACHNPWDPARSPGGSSGGSAVAVATGMCLAALGSDTGGSIRLPSAFCGVSGFKPSYGAVSTEGATPLAWSLDHVGPMCRSARDCRTVYSVLRGGGVELPAAPTHPLRIGMPRAWYFDDLDPAVARALEEAAAVFRRSGGEVSEVRLPALRLSPELKFLPEPYLTIISAEAFAYHREMLSGHPDRYHQQTRAIIAGGGGVSATDYIRARREMDRLRASSGELFRDADLLLTPTAPGPAFELGKPSSLVFLRNTAPWNQFGLPTISIPCGFTPAGLPLGMQITGPAGADSLVLSIAEAFQKATDWHTKRPPV